MKSTTIFSLTIFFNLKKEICSQGQIPYLMFSHNTTCHGAIDSVPLQYHRLLSTGMGGSGSRILRFIRILVGFTSRSSLAVSEE